MGKIKHNKLKNTGILFEILVKNLIHETMNPSTNQYASKILKKHFNKGSKLLYELQMYQQLCEVDVSVSPDELLNIVIDSRNKIDSIVLNQEKYNLVKQIKESYNLDDFFKNRVNNYKLLASIYNLFEHSPSVNPTQYLLNKQTIVESLSTKKEPDNVDVNIKEILHEDRKVRNLAMKMMVKRFNEKYKGLGERQRTLISKCINENTESPQFRNFIVNECNYISSELNNKIQNINESVTKIKLTEVNNLLQNILTATTVKDEHLSSLLKYHELLGEL